MRKNITTSFGEAAEGGGRRLEWDWYAGLIPANVEFGRDVYVDTSYGFAPFSSEERPGLVLGDATGAYDRATFVVGPRGRVRVGAYTVLNGTYVVCNGRVEIGDHCLVAWGSVITDTWAGLTDAPAEARRAALAAAARDERRRLPPLIEPRAVVLEDNCWVGFEAVVLPGVRIGRGAVVGSKTVVAEDVPPYAVVVGSPPRVVRRLEPDDTPEERERALKEYARRDG
jgi:acetyltransferase-like isoleucine patch superfamily enzyme